MIKCKQKDLESNNHQQILSLKNCKIWMRMKKMTMKKPGISFIKIKKEN